MQIQHDIEKIEYANLEKVKNNVRTTINSKPNCRTVDESQRDSRLIAARIFIGAIRCKNRKGVGTPKGLNMTSNRF
jgi:hypothetical protein